MAFVALVTLLALGLYVVLTAHAAFRRGKGKIAAPATTGEENFERALRIQLNTAEQLLLFLPAMWLAGLYASWGWSGSAPGPSIPGATSVRLPRAGRVSSSVWLRP